MKKILKDISDYYKQNEREIGLGIFLILIGVLISSILYPPIATSIVKFILTILGFINQNIQDYYYSGIDKNSDPMQGWVLLQFVTIFLLMSFAKSFKYELLRAILFYFKGKKYKLYELMEIDKNEEKSFPSEKFMYISILLSTIILLALFLLSFNSVSLKKTFERQLLQLTPYISQEKITELNIEWTYINSKADYDKLISKINRYYKEYKVRED